MSQGGDEIAPYVRNLGRLVEAWSPAADDVDVGGRQDSGGGEALPGQQESVNWELVRARIAAIDAEAAAYLRATRPANTSRAYAGDWKVWTPFCARMGLPELMFSPGLLTAFAVYLWHGDPETGLAPAAPATIRRRITGVVVTLRDHGVAVPRGAAEPAYTAVDRLEREHARASEQPRGRGKAAALGVTHLQLICRELPDTLTGKRDKAILLLGFGLGARSHALADLFITDLTLEERGLLVDRRWGKAGREATVAVPYGKHRLTCPVRAWLEWQQAASLTQGRAFRSIDRHSNLGESLTGQSISAVITRAAAAAGLTIRATGHSVRRGMATGARKAGHDVQAIARQGGWSPHSPAIWEYFEVEDAFADNALTGIGL